MESKLQWHQPTLSEERASSPTLTLKKLQTYLRIEPLTSLSDVSLLPPTRKKPRRLLKGENSSQKYGTNGELDYYVRLGLWASKWLPAFLLNGKK